MPRCWRELRTVALEPAIYLIDTDKAFVETASALASSMHIALRTFNAASEFLRQFNASSPGCLILEMRLPDMSGLDLQKQLLRAPISPPVIFVTAHADVRAVVRAKQQGAFRLMTKQGLSETELWGAIMDALAVDREARLRHERRQELVARLDALTLDERRTFDMLLSDNDMAAIAAALGITRRSAEKRRTRIMGKLGLDNLADLVRFGVDAGLLPPRRETPPLR